MTNHALAGRLAISSALVLGLVCCGSGGAVASGSSWSLELDLGSEPRRLVPAPPSGLRLELWSDPSPGTLVRPGDRAHIRFMASEDCYVTLISVDTEGRARLLFPDRYHDGWIAGHRDYWLPDGHRDLMFEGPAGVEYLFAVASIDPIMDRCPDWLLNGCAPTPEPWCRETDFFALGWIVGDPFYQFHLFGRRLAARPECPESYTSAWISFTVAERVSYPRSVCRDCHGFAPLNPYGPPCSVARIVVESSPCGGWFDLRVGFRPHFWYEPCDWRYPDHDRRVRHRERARWSSCDGTVRLREVFQPGPKPHSASPREERWEGGRHKWGEFTSPEIPKTKDRAKKDREVRKRDPRTSPGRIEDRRDQRPGREDRGTERGRSSATDRSRRPR